MRSFWHLIRGHDVQAATYMGIRTRTRRCFTCHTTWEVR